MNINPVFILITAFLGIIGYLINNTKGCLIAIAIWLGIAIIGHFYNRLTE